MFCIVTDCNWRDIRQRRQNESSRPTKVGVAGTEFASAQHLENKLSSAETIKYFKLNQMDFGVALLRIIVCFKPSGTAEAKIERKHLINAVFAAVRLIL